MTRKSDGSTKVVLSAVRFGLALSIASIAESVAVAQASTIPYSDTCSQSYFAQWDNAYYTVNYEMVIERISVTETYRRLQNTDSHRPSFPPNEPRADNLNPYFYNRIFGFYAPSVVFLTKISSEQPILRCEHIIQIPSGSTLRYSCQNNYTGRSYDPNVGTGIHVERSGHAVDLPCTEFFCFQDKSINTFSINRVILQDDIPYALQMSLSMVQSCVNCDGGMTLDENRVWRGQFRVHKRFYWRREGNDYLFLVFRIVRDGLRCSYRPAPRAND